MAITESQLEERLMRMGNEARYMKAKFKALDTNELRKIAIKQLTKEAEKHTRLQAKTYQEWIDLVENSPVEIHDIITFRNNIPTLQRYVGKAVLDAVKQYQFRYIHGNIPVFTD